MLEAEGLATVVRFSICVPGALRGFLSSSPYAQLYTTGRGDEYFVTFSSKHGFARLGYGFFSSQSYRAM